LWEWPASKFEKFYEAYAKRKVADELSHRRALETAALWGNTNLDTEENENARQTLMQSIDTSYSTAIKMVYGEEVDLPEKEVDWDDPWWAAAKRGMEKRKLPDTTL